MFDTTRPYPEFAAEYPPALTTAGVAAMLDTTPDTVRRRVHDEGLPAYRWGRNYRYLRDEVLDWLRQQTTDPEQKNLQ